MAVKVVHTNERGEDKMKKMLLVMAAVALVAGERVQAQSETVTSVNVVGYYSVTIPPNGIALVTPVLESFQAGTIVDLVGEQLPGGSAAFTWDREAKDYVIATKAGRGGWTGAGSSNVILRGDGVWLRSGDTTNPRTITFMGEVPAGYNLAQTTIVDNITGTEAVGYGYPIDILWTNTTLSQLLPSGASINVWKVDTQDGYITATKAGRGGWSSPQIAMSAFVIKAGQAFWVTTTSPIEWEEEAPYDL